VGAGAAGDTLGMAAVVVILPGLLVGGVAREDVVDGDQDRMRHSDDGLLVPPVAHEATVARTEGIPSGADRAQRGFGQRGPEPAVALPSSAGFAFAGALVVPGASS
jgi:hypothetical protein